MILGNKINLRLIKESDLSILTALVNNLSQRGKFLGVELASEISFKKHFNDTGFWDKDFGKMLITDKEDNILGDITFSNPMAGFDDYEIGCNIFDEKNRGKGYAKEALKLFTAYLFETKSVHRLSIRIFSGNIPSRKITEECGYKYEGTMREAIFSRGKYHDVECFSILRSECISLDNLLN